MSKMATITDTLFAQNRLEPCLEDGDKPEEREQVPQTPVVNMTELRQSQPNEIQLVQDEIIEYHRDVPANPRPLISVPLLYFNNAMKELMPKKFRRGLTDNEEHLEYNYPGILTPNDESMRNILWIISCA
jgi:hypothetical protein